MNTLYPGLTYEHQNGQVTTYDLQEVQHGNRPRFYVASESPVNQGPGFEELPTRDAVARDASARIQAKDGVEPSKVYLYQQKPDGDFDRVYFLYDGESRGFRETWRERHRDSFTRAVVQKELGSDLFAAPETPQQLKYGPVHQTQTAPQFRR